MWVWEPKGNQARLGAADPVRIDCEEEEAAGRGHRRSPAFASTTGPGLFPPNTST